MAADDPDPPDERGQVDDSDPSPSNSAFELFYRQRWRDAARWGTALCGNVHRGEEIAQEAFLRVAPRYDALDQPAAYLRRTIVNLVYEHHRADDRRSRREDRVARLTVVTGDDAFESTPDPALFAALDELSITQRSVLVLRYWADWDDAAIADAIGCRRGSVRSHAKRGLDRLRAHLEETS